MKRYLLPVIVLITVVGLVTAVFASIRRRQAMEIMFNKRDISKHGVRIITSVDPEFEIKAANQLKEGADQISPLSVFVENTGDKPIVAYMLVWQLVKKNGQILTDRTSYSEPAILMGDPKPTDPAFKHTQVIMPQEGRLFSWSGPGSQAGLGSLNATSSNPPSNLRRPDMRSIRDQLNVQLAEVTDVTVSLDGVFFDDGTFVGPNSSSFFERIKALVNAKLDLREEVAVASEQGNLDEAFQSIDKKSEADEIILTSESSADDYYKHYSKLFAREISGMHRTYGKERVARHLVNLHKRPHPHLKKEQP